MWVCPITGKNAMNDKIAKYSTIRVVNVRYCFSVLLKLLRYLVELSHTCS